jgi:DNA-binding transcriptional regulator YiaG
VSKQRQGYRFSDAADSEEEQMMQPAIRIIKRGAGHTTNGPAVNEIEKTVQQREREMVNTVKSWVAEWETRNRALKNVALSLMRESLPHNALQS